MAAAGADDGEADLDILRQQLSTPTLEKRLKAVSVGVSLECSCARPVPIFRSQGFPPPTETTT
jgi:hypothetical protein